MLTHILPLILAATPVPERAETLYSSLDPKSPIAHLTLASLYPDTPAGRRALHDAWQLLRGTGTPTPLPSNLPNPAHLVNLLQRQHTANHTPLPHSSLATLNHLAARLPNRTLPGHTASNLEEILSLAPDDIDIAHALLLDDPNSAEYEAMLDLMALELLARLGNERSPKAIIAEMNRLIFEKMRFRFPPHSLYAQDIDRYTFLPSVLDSRLGVCLGVSVLYLSIAERIGLPLEMVTPPGHIYVRWRSGSETVNIETTARGIHLPDETYLGIDTVKLHERTKKEVIGLVSINEASIHLQKGDYKRAVECYEKAAPFLPNDKLLLELTGICHVMLDNKDKGFALLKASEKIDDPCTTSKETLVADILAGKVDRGGLEALFKSVDEKRSSILEKKALLEESLKRCPEFRDGQFQLAVAWLQLHRTKEALPILEKYHKMCPEDATAAYYLAILYHSRLQGREAREAYLQAEELCRAKGHFPKALKELKRELGFGV